MNKEIREFLDKEALIIKKIIIKGNVYIIDTNNGSYVIKKKGNDLEDIFYYLKSRSFDYFPRIIGSTDNYYFYEYIRGIELEDEEAGVDLIKLLTLLHNKTTYYRDIDDDYYKEIYEGVCNKISYLRGYYNDIVSMIEKDEYMSPSYYLFVRNVTTVFHALNYCEYNINSWLEIIEEKKRVRIVNLHNNLELDHYILGDGPYFISWDNSKKDMPIKDLIIFYKRYYEKLDFCDILRNYESRYPLLPEEKILFFVLVSLPDKLEFMGDEYTLCTRVRKFYDYINVTEKLISDYFPIRDNFNEKEV